MGMVWTENLILAIVESQDGGITPEVRDSVTSAMQALSEEPIPRRTLLRFMNHCTHPGVNDLLGRFVSDARRLSVFDTVNVPEKARDEA